MTASPNAKVPISKLTQLKADAVSHRERIAAVDTAAFTTVGELAEWIKTELGLNLAPMFESTVDALNEDVIPEILDLRDAVDEIADETGDQLTEETSSQILAVLQQGRAICNALETLAKSVDAVTRTRLGKAIKLYRAQETAIRDLVVAITLPPDEGDDEGEGDDEDGDDGESDAAAPTMSDDESAGEPGEDLLDDAAAASPAAPTGGEG